MKFPVYLSDGAHLARLSEGWWGDQVIKAPNHFEDYLGPILCVLDTAKRPLSDGFLGWYPVRCIEGWWGDQVIKARAQSVKRVSCEAAVKEVCPTPVRNIL